MKHNTIEELFTGIADSIRAKKETTDMIVADNFPEEISSIQGGVDTSDATATASDIKTGKTAYVKDNKITGSLEFEQPSIEIASTGLITATANGISNTKKLNENNGGIFYPTTYNQYAAFTGDYIGNQPIVVAGDSNLVSDNIKYGMSIFGVQGTLKVPDYITKPDNSRNTVFTSGQVIIPLCGLPSDFNDSWYIYGCLPYPEYPLAINFSGLMTPNATGISKMTLLKTSNSGTPGVFSGYSISDKTITITGSTSTLSQTKNTQGYGGYLFFYSSDPELVF